YARPAVQPRDASRYLLLESPDMPIWGMPIMGPMPSYQLRGQLVLHHATGAEEPRVILSREGQYDLIGLFAMNETPDGARHYLVMTNPESTSGSSVTPPPPPPPPPPPGTIAYPPGTTPSTSPYPLPRYLYSNDDGATWKILDLPDVLGTQDFLRQDIGGNVTRGRGSQIRLGTSETPFIFGAAARNQPGASTVFYAVDKGGAVRPLIEMSADAGALLMGSDRTGSRFLIAGSPIVSSVAQPTGIRILDLDGTLQSVLPLAVMHPQMEGWITSSGAVYLEETGPNVGTQRVSYIDGGIQTLLTAGPRGWSSGEVIFAVPTHDFDGAWMVQRNSGAPTRLLRHLPGSGVEEMWKDITGPEVEAIHAASSGERLLIQVHRPRAADGRVIIDPALAIWEIGAPMPRRYDELFLAEGPAKGFVSLDVDAAALGAPFVFDSAPLTNSGGGGVIVSPAPPGGGDVTQEWGVVRASLQQKLVLPALARLPGAFGSFWKSDVTVWNPDTEAMTLRLRFAPSDGTPHLERELTVAAGELSYVPDALHTWFGLESGGGALFIEPPLGHAIGITSRLYTETPEGSFGMGVSPIDIFAASSARYYLTFAGALQGASTRTNLLVTDAGGHGSSFGVKASGPTGFTGRTDAEFDVPPGGQIQINDLATVLGVSGQAAARFETLGGFTIPSLVSIDNRTNDPTMFPPDVVSGVMRVIPMIGHLEGANGSRFRTDLYLYNPSDKLKSVGFSAKSLDVDEPESHVNFTLLPFESKVIPDVYKMAFNKEGLGR
ncbi:MAG: hypothetical protein LC732_01760, partial [Acidobacteria bacterium]|nr:hypothetical protein [Acidobacteriota bacterium]